MTPKYKPGQKLELVAKLITVVSAIHPEVPGAKEGMLYRIRTPFTPEGETIVVSERFLDEAEPA
jgi:hypothetical protein